VDKESTTINGRICFRIPLIVPERSLVPNPPDPPFLAHAGLGPESARHLQVLATIDELAEILPAELSHDLQRIVIQHMKKLGEKLGPGVEFSRHHHGEGEHRYAQ
jgi:hypothetical protein